MKIPFYTIFGPPLRRNYKTLKKICNLPILDVCGTYVIFLGTLGMVLSLFDIVRIVNYGPVLPSPLVRDRIKTGRIVSAECERDLKLMFLVLSFEYYLLLVLGITTENSVLFLPWLVFYAFIIMLEFFVFVVRLFVEGFNSTRHGLTLSMFVIYNWLSVFCTFFQLIGGCDF